MHGRILGTRALAIVACVIAGALNAAAQKVETGFLNRSIQVDGADFRYQVYVPRDFQPATSWPVILALHGGGEYGSDGLRQTGGGLAAAIRRHADRFPALVVFPQSHADGTPGWHLAGGGDFSAAAAALRLPMPVRYASTVLGIIALPVVLGTAAVIAVNQPMPGASVNARVAEASFWLFAALGALVTKRDARKGVKAMRRDGPTAR